MVSIHDSKYNIVTPKNITYSYLPILHNITSLVSFPSRAPPLRSPPYHTWDFVVRLLLGNAFMV